VRLYTKDRLAYNIPCLRPVPTQVSSQKQLRALVTRILGESRAKY
jgi:hypothetical protein